MEDGELWMGGNRRICSLPTVVLYINCAECPIEGLRIVCTLSYNISHV